MSCKCWEVVKRIVYERRVIDGTFIRKTYSVHVLPLSQTTPNMYDHLQPMQNPECGLKRCCLFHKYLLSPLPLKNFSICPCSCFLTLLRFYILLNHAKRSERLMEMFMVAMQQSLQSKL